MSHPVITAARLREVLHYDPLTGLFTWRVSRRGPAKAGREAGCRDEYGYVHITIDGRQYNAHRLAWLYVHGEWPIHQLDHRFGVTDDNRISRLRVATNGQNNQNRRKAHGNNRCGVLGVGVRGGRWRARITVDGKEKHIGTFDTPELAHAAYLDEKVRLHPFQTLA